MCQADNDFISSKQVIEEKQQHRHRASVATATVAVDDLTSRLADPMVARYTHASPTLLAAPAHAAQQQLLLQQQRHQHPASSLLRKLGMNEQEGLTSVLETFSNWLSTTWNRCMDHSSKSKHPLVIERPAKHECEAAGKMHQIFEEVRS